MTESTNKFSLLRSEASQRRKTGTAPRSNSVLSVESLASLHKLANASDGAETSLTLLHELQVHQIELDMQHEQIEANARELTENLNHYKAIYDFAPVGYFIINPEGRIIDANHAASDLFDLEIGAMQGCPFDSLLAIESRFAIHGLLKQLQSGSRRELCEARTDGVIPRSLLIRASTTDSADFYLLACMDASDFR